VQCVHFGAEENWFVTPGRTILLALGFAQFFIERERERVKRDIRQRKARNKRERESYSGHISLVSVNPSVKASYLKVVSEIARRKQLKVINHFSLPLSYLRAPSQCQKDRCALV
jgi:hypothetical protein